MNQLEIDLALDKVLRAAGSGLKYYCLPEVLEDMRGAMRTAMEESYKEGANDAARGIYRESLCKQ